MGKVIDVFAAVRLPARLTSEQTAEIIGFQAHDLPVLVSANLLKPLGKPAAVAPKYFAACDIRELAENREWLSKATQAVSRNWKSKNSRRKSKDSPHLVTHPDSV